jgi:hypothetical protein
VRPSALAVLRLMNSSTLVACDRATGRQDEHAAGGLLKTKIGRLGTATRGSARVVALVVPAPSSRLANPDRPLSQPLWHPMGRVSYTELLAEACGAERSRQTQDAKAGSEALFGMRPVLQDEIAERRGCWPDERGIPADAADGPVGVTAMTGRHIIGQCWCAC